MKTSAIPPVRVSPELRQAVEDLLQSGETLSAFVEEAVRRNVEFRTAQQAFLEKGLAAAAKAKKSGKYVSSATVLAKIRRRLKRAGARDDATS